ncbi:MAG: 30S ribosome-binding factor RbfA [Acidimicrobiales bacterium]
MAKRSSGGRKSRPATKRHFPRTARLNSLLVEIVADYFERADDDRFGFLTITGVEVDADLNVAQVFVSTLGGASDDDDELLEALDSHRKPVQRAIATEAKLRKTPMVVFEFDQGVRHGARVEEILATLDLHPDTEVDDTEVDGTGTDDLDGGTD